MHIHHLLQVQDINAAYTTVIGHGVIQAADVHSMVLLYRRYAEIHADTTNAHQAFDMGAVH